MDISETRAIPRVDYQAWRAQNNSAKRRGIDFLFTLEEWLAWWQRELAAKGPDAERGLRKHQYMMCRYGDTGPYAAGNVYCGTCADNFADPAFKKTQSAHWTQWHSENDAYMKGRRGAAHPASRAVVTPAGRFESIALAAEHYGITRQGGFYRVRRGEWAYDTTVSTCG